MRDEFAVFNIGCIECGVSSGLVGVYASFDEAQKVAERLRKTHEWREGGQNDYRVFQLSDVGVTASEYMQPA
jgi:hypothetical protein